MHFLKQRFAPLDHLLELFSGFPVLEFQLLQTGHLQLLAAVFVGQGFDECVNVLSRSGDEGGEELRVVLLAGVLLGCLRASPVEIGKLAGRGELLQDSNRVAEMFGLLNL